MAEHLRREGDVVNQPLTPQEAVHSAFGKIAALTDIGLCEGCAIKLVAHNYGIDHERLRVLWTEQPEDGHEDDD